MSDALAIRTEVLDGEPRASALDIGAALGFERERDIKKIVERNREELELYGAVTMRATVARIEKRGAISGFEDREVLTPWLNEEQALLVAMMSRTPKAVSVRRALIEAFMAYRRGASFLSEDVARALLAEVQGLRASVHALTTGRPVIGDEQATRTIKAVLVEFALVMSGDRKRGKRYRSERQRLEMELRGTLGHRLPWHMVAREDHAKAIQHLYIMRQRIAASHPRGQQLAFPGAA